MNLNNEVFFMNCSGEIPWFNTSGFIKPKKLYHTCEYCNSDVEIQAVRCNSCGAPKNSYKFKERNYNE